jgi:hypothetical protein
MKLQGLQFLEGQFTWQADHMIHVLLYKNLDPDKRTHHTLGLGMWVLQAKECRDVAWNLQMIRSICEDGETAPEEYDPYYDAFQDVELDPTQDEPIPYDPYREMSVYMHCAHAPHGLGNKLSQAVIDGAEILLQGPRTLQRFEDEMGSRLMTRNVGDPEGPFRPMTDEERTLHARKAETAFIEATLFLLDFNSEMERLGEMILSRAPLADILALIGPVPEPEPEPGEPLQF